MVQRQQFHEFPQDLLWAATDPHTLHPGRYRTGVGWRRVVGEARMLMGLDRLHRLQGHFLPMLTPFLATGGKVTLLRCADLSIYPILDGNSDLVREYFALLKSDLGQVQQEGLALEVMVLEGDLPRSFLPGRLNITAISSLCPATAAPACSICGSAA